MRIVSLFAAACLGLLCLSPAAVSQDAAAASKLQVRVNYTGSGMVDSKHKIYVVLWDSPAFVTGEAMPAEMQPSSSNQGTVTFSNITKSTVYISAVYEPKGEWDGQSGPPPDGSSLGLYTKQDPRTPEPIEIKPGKTTSIELKFDDTVKMTAGKPAR